MAALVDVNSLSFRYARAEWVLRDLTFSIPGPSTLGIVGESGSGKSTLARLLCGLLPLSVGSISVDGREIKSWLTRRPREFKRHSQIVFQNPGTSFDPRMRVGRSLAEPIRSLERRRVTSEELEESASLVGLNADLLCRYPHQLSGGQLQRFALARAVSVKPRILYADEVTSALDVSVQAQVLNLLLNLRRKLDLSLVMVSHDLAVIGCMCDQVIVMHNGMIVEAGPTTDVLGNPGTAYTAALIDAARAVSLESGTSLSPSG